jgi:LPPG:FO 2-phospho-L-lactate transferase
MITALAGGVGAARFLTGLVKLAKEEDISVIVNTGDDIEMFGLHVSPDIDIVTYTLAGIVNEEKGWGIKGDTFCCLEMLKKLGLETWFNLGDKDLATNILRTNLLKEGLTLSKVTSKICLLLGVKVNIIPMTDDRFETRITLEEGSVHFEEYFVKKACRGRILGVEFVGATTAKPSPKVIDSILEAEKVVVCPSNPIVSVGTILSVKGIRESLRRTNAKIIGISPIVAGAPIKGPADKLLASLGLEVSAYSVAKLYADFLDVFIIDQKDAALADRIRQLGVNVKIANTIMDSAADKIALAKAVLES